MSRFTKPDLPREHERQFWPGIRARFADTSKHGPNVPAPHDRQDAEPGRSRTMRHVS